VGEVGEGLVDVGGGATGGFGAELDVDVGELVDGGHLAHFVDNAAGGSATELDACGAFEDFYLLEVEAVAVVAAEVADAVEEDIVPRGKAADGEVVALGSAFAGGDADAGNVADGVEEGAVLFVLEDEVGDLDDGLGRVEEGFGEFGHADGVGEAAVDVDRLLVAEADVHGVGTLEGEVEAGAGEELAEGRVVGIEADDSVGGEGGQGFGWDFELEGYTTLLAVLVECRGQRTLSYTETPNG